VDGILDLLGEVGSVVGKMVKTDQGQYQEKA
jgi:hypothetical protein